MGLESIVNVVITSNNLGVSRASFGVPKVLGYHTKWYDTYKIYSLGTIIQDLVADGFTAYDPVYRACTALARNTPKPKTVVVGRLKTAFTQQFKITILSAAVEVGRTLSFTVISPSGATTLISYVVQAGDTDALIATAIAALVTAITNLTAASALAVITVDADNAGEMWYLSGFDINMMGFEETTADSSLATENAVIDTTYKDTYGVILADPNSKARITVLAAAIETQERILGYTTHDTEVGNGASTTDMMYTLKASAYLRTYGIYTTEQGTYAAATWMGSRFPVDPGASTWAYKTLSGVAAETLPTGWQTAIAGKNGNYYDTEMGTIDGKMAGGEWIDVIRGRDWFTARLRERIAILLKNAPKVPFTQKGAESVGKEVDAQIKEGIAKTYLSEDNDPAYTVTVPDVTDPAQVSAANKQARTLPGVKFECYLAGAIHVVDPLNGVIRV